MGDIPVLQIYGLVLFAILAIGLVAIQCERLARYRWGIFLGCMACFAGTVVVGWLTYVPSDRTLATLYDDVRNSGNGGAFFGGGRSRSGSPTGGGGTRSGGRIPAGTNSIGRSGRGGSATRGGAGSDAGFPSLSSAGTFTDCAKCPVMVTIPAGETDIGTKAGDFPASAQKSEPVRVRFARPFAVSRYEIKLDEFLVFASQTNFQPSGACNTDSVGGAAAGFQNPGFHQNRHHPVVCVSFHDANRYAAWLSERANTPYRLLSESEWEYVRRGTKGPSDIVDGSPVPLSDDGNFRWDGWVASTTPAGRYASNGFDVHDMMGNAGEWTADCWHDDPGTVPANGRARLSSGDCSAHAVRGGSWDDHAENSRPASRQKVEAGTRDWRIGFRVMRPAAEDLPISQ